MGIKKDNSTPDLSRIIELQSFLQKFHNIERVIHLSKSSERRETDTEHSYTLSLIAWYLAQYFPELDTNLCIRYALVHDLVEIHAGDTFAFAEKAIKDTKVERERLALNKIRQEWSDFKELTDDIQEYESLKSAEACFVYALDKIVPSIVILLGEGRTWQEYNITLQDLKDEKKAKVEKSKQIIHYYEALMKMLEDYPEFFPK